MHATAQAAYIKAIRLVRVRALKARREWGINCDCPTVRDGRPHHWSCGTNRSAL